MAFRKQRMGRRKVCYFTKNNIQYIDYKDGICYLKFLGHCANCSLMMVTLDEGIKEALINEIPEIIDVKLVNEFEEDSNINFFDIEDDDF